MEKKFLFEMLETPSVSGSEFALNKKVKKHMEEYADTFITDEVGNLVSVINPDSNVKVLLAAHADEIGLMITRILNDGRCKVEEVGSITAGVYVGQRVKVITKNGPVTGMIAKFRNSFAATPKDSDLVLDLGVFSKEDAEKLVEYFIYTYAPSRSERNKLDEFEGFIYEGPEYLTMFGGDGKELETIYFPYPREDDGLMWGDYALARIEPCNRVDRFLSGVAYLDGERPYLIICRGYYTRATIVAYDFLLAIKNAYLNRFFVVISKRASNANT